MSELENLNSPVPVPSPEATSVPSAPPRPVSSAPPVVTATATATAAVDIEKKAEQIKNEIVRKANAANRNVASRYGFVDPITVLMLISIMIGLIRVVQECRKDKLSRTNNRKEQAGIIKDEILSLGPKPGLFQKRKIKKILVANMSKEQYKLYGSHTYDELVNVGSTVTDEQVLALLEYKKNV